MAVFASFSPLCDCIGPLIFKVSFLLLCVAEYLVIKQAQSGTCSSASERGRIGGFYTMC